MLFQYEREQVESSSSGKPRGAEADIPNPAADSPKPQADDAGDLVTW